MTEETPEFQALCRADLPRDESGLSQSAFLAGYTAGLTARDEEVARYRVALDLLLSRLPMALHNALSQDGMLRSIGIEDHEALLKAARKALADQPDECPRSLSGKHVGFKICQFCGQEQPEARA